MNITNMGKRWEWLNSFWLIWMFTFMFSWVAFFWIGTRTKQKKWILSGCLYLVFCFVLPTFGTYIKGTVFANIITAMFIFAWIASVVHTALSRKEYLIRREAVIKIQSEASIAYREKLQADYANQSSVDNQKINQYYDDQTPSFDKQQVHIEPSLSSEKLIEKKINLNIASEQEISLLPGVGVVLAKKAVILRQMQAGGFASVNDFCDKLSLMPHFTVQIQKLTFVSPLEIKKPIQENKGRIVDI